MDYGKMIRSAREDLGLYLKDCAKDNLSINGLSNIEKGNTKLSKSKALIIYRVITQASWRLNKFPVCNFDDLLCGDATYKMMTLANDLCHGLDDKIKNKQAMTPQEYDQVMAIVNDKAIGFLTYYLYMFTGHLLEDSKKQEKLDIYTKALDYMYWTDMEAYVWPFKQCLKKCLPLAYSLGDFDMLKKYYKRILEAEEKYAYRVDPSIYYNLALFYSQSDLWETALKYLDIYIDQSYDWMLVDQADTLILKAVILGKGGQYNKAIDLSHKVLGLIKDENLIHQESLCMSNVLLWVYKQGCKSHMSMVLTYVEKLGRWFDEGLIKRASKESLFVNRGLAYTMLGQGTKAMACFRVSLASTLNHKVRLTLLDEAYQAITSLDGHELISDHLMAIDVDRLDEKSLNLYYKLLLKSRHLSWKQDTRVWFEKCIDKIV